MTHFLEPGADIQLTLFDMTAQGRVLLPAKIPEANADALDAAAKDVGVNPPRLQGVPYSKFHQARLRECELGIENELPF